MHSRGKSGGAGGEGDNGKRFELNASGQMKS